MTGAERFLNRVSGLRTRIETETECERAASKLVPPHIAALAPDAARAAQGLADAYAEQRIAYESELAEAYRVVSAIANEGHRRMIELHYLKGKPWDSVASELHYSVSGLMSARRRAVQSLDAVLAKIETRRDTF